MDIDSAHLDLIIFRLKRVGRKHLSNYELWAEWLERV